MEACQQEIREMETKINKNNAQINLCKGGLEALKPKLNLIMEEVGTASAAVHEVKEQMRQIEKEIYADLSAIVGLRTFDGYAMNCTNTRRKLTQNDKCWENGLQT